MDFPKTCPDAHSLMEFGAEFACSLRPGSVVALVGNLGMGKTHFTKGMMQGLSSKEIVTSPTFALLQEYSGGSLPVYHFDLYRLGSEGEVIELGWDDYLESESIVVAEWADRFPNLFPAESIWLKISAHSGGRIIEKISPPSLLS